METYKITYTYTTPRGVLMEGKCIVKATSEKHAILVASWLKHAKILSVKLAGVNASKQSQNELR
jgi:hypothetical protein